MIRIAGWILLALGGILAIGAIVTVLLGVFTAGVILVGVAGSMRLWGAF